MILVKETAFKNKEHELVLELSDQEKEKVLVGLTSALSAKEK